MALWDWVEIISTQTGGGSGKAGKLFDEFETATQGVVGVTLGDYLQGVIFGGQQGHTFGEMSFLTVDYDLLVEKVLGMIPGVGAVLHSPVGSLLMGVGGEVTWTYGRSTTACYGGPSVEIRRAPERKATGVDYLFSNQPKIGMAMPPLDFATLISGSAAEPTGPQQQGAQYKIDKVSGVVAAILSALMILVVLALDLLIYLKQTYPTLKHLPGNNDAGPKGTIQLLKDCSWTISSSLQALIVDVESAAQVARDAVQNYQSGVQLTKSEKNALTAMMRMDVVDCKQRLVKAYNDAESTTKQALQAAAILALFVLGGAAVIGILVGGEALADKGDL